MQAQGFAELVRRAQAGDGPAAEELLERIGPWLEKLAPAYVDARQPAASVSDLVQAGCLRIWQTLGQFQGGGDDQATLAMFRVWVGRVMASVGLNVIREREALRRHPPGKLECLHAQTLDHSTVDGDPPAEQPSPSTNAAAEELLRLIHQALDKLDDATQKDIVRLQFFEGLSLRQIADRLGINREQVRQEFHAAMRQLEHDLRSLL